MKICFFSDIHGNIYALNSFIEQSAKQDIDMFIFGGDFFGYYYYADECIGKIKNLPNCKCILGNHDQYFLDVLNGNLPESALIFRYGNSYMQIVSKISNENINFIKSLPSFIKIKADNMTMVFFHGAPDGSLTDRVYPDTDLNLINVSGYDVCFLGHTHHKMLRYKNNTMIINPGSAGQQRDGKGTSYVIYDTVRNYCEFYTFQYDVNKLLNDINLYDKNNIRLAEVLLRKA